MSSVASLPSQSAGATRLGRWPHVKLREILELQRRWFTPAPDELYVEIGVKSFGKGLFHKPPISGLELGNKRVLRIEPGDLIFNNVFAWEGAVAVSGKSEADTIGSHRFITLTSRNGACDVRYLCLYFRTEPGLDLLRRASPGSAGRNRTLGIDRFLDQEVPLPPLPEQQRIVAKIERLAARIEEAREARQRSEQAAVALWRVGAARVLRPIGHDKWRRLGDLVDIGGGGTPSKQNPAFWGGPIPWVSPKDMKAREITDSIDHISETALRAVSRHIARAGSSSRGHPRHDPGAHVSVSRPTGSGSNQPRHEGAQAARGAVARISLRGVLGAQ